MRTACVWLLVQNKARAEPWTSWDTTKIANASETAIRAHETAIMSAAPTRRALSGTLRISAPRKIRVTNCETAASATIIPTSTVLYPTAMANIGTTTARVPRANENNTVAAMLRILSAPDRPTVWPLQDDGTPPLGRSPVREPARRFLRRAFRAAHKAPVLLIELAAVGGLHMRDAKEVPRDVNQAAVHRIRPDGRWTSGHWPGRSSSGSSNKREKPSTSPGLRGLTSNSSTPSKAGERSASIWARCANPARTRRPRQAG